MGWLFFGGLNVIIKSLLEGGRKVGEKKQCVMEADDRESEFENTEEGHEPRKAGGL